MHVVLSVVVLSQLFRIVTCCVHSACCPVSRSAEPVVPYCDLLCAHGASCSIDCSSQSLSPYCDVWGLKRLDKLTCTHERKAVAYCSLQKSNKIIDSKYQVCL